jgi:hypothetical protein
MAIEEDRKTFLADEQWQTIPWIPEGGNVPEGKGFANRFLDVLLCIPSLLEDMRAIQTDQERECTVASMRESIASLHERLLDIRLDWEILKPRSAYEVPLANIDRNGRGKFSIDEQGAPLFKSIIYYQDLQSCTEMGVYHSCLYFLRWIATAIGMPAPSTMPQRAEQDKTNKALKFPDEIPTRRDACVEICRSAEYYLQPSHGITGAYFLLMPLRMAQFAFEQGAAENEEDRRLVRWSCGIMRHIAENHGFHNAYAYCNG